ncbi:MAG: flagellar hook protein FlgE [Candidatus Azotimanducaceae bacterium]|jgi:flagellar hook protein FlgE
MPFNTALSGLKAASSDLKITGNNIANASTIGFKESRAEFADVYSSSLLGNGSTTPGTGVELSNVAQQFEQGTIGFTSNSLDVAIDGQGFFVLDDGGSRTYTRAGMFGLDQDGFITSNSGARLQGFTANEAGTLNGVISDIVIQTGNLAPNQTTRVESDVNLDAESEVLAQFGTTINTLGRQIGEAQGGVGVDVPSVVNTLAVPTPFNFSINNNSAISASAALVPFDFSIDVPSAVTAIQGATGYDFSVNSPSSLSSTSAPVNFNFATRPVAVTAAAGVTGFDFSGGAGTFDVTLGANTAVPVTLNTNITNIGELIADINDQLGGSGVVAAADPLNISNIEFQATNSASNEAITVDNYGGASAANVQAALGGLADGSTSAGSRFDVTIAGGASDGTATVNLTANITTLAGLVADINDQLSVSGANVLVREDPDNAGRLQFFSEENGVASTVTVDNYVAGTSSTTTANLTNLLGVASGATSAVPGAGASGNTGSVTAATFELSIADGSGAGGNVTTTVTLDQDVSAGGVAALAALINTQLAGLAAPGIDVRAQEDPDNAGLLQFYATVNGEASTVTVGNYQVSAITGSQITTTADVAAALGGIVDGSTDNTGNNTNASFQVRLSGGANGAANLTQTITLDSSITTLQDLIVDIRDDLQSAGIGVDVREDPLNPGLLQFYATVSGEASVIEIDPNTALNVGIGATQADVENVLGGIAMSASTTIPDPTLTGTTAALGSLTSATFDVSLDGASVNNGGPVTVTLDSDIQDLDDLINDIRDDLRIANIGVDVREDPDNVGRLQFFATTAGEASNITVNNFIATNDGVTTANLASVLNVSSGVTIPGIAAVDNAYQSQSIDIINASGREVVTNTVTTLAGETAAQIAARFNSIPGIIASASTTASLMAADYVNNSGAMTVSINGVEFISASLADLAGEINASDSLGGVSAEVDAATGDLTITNVLGTDLRFSISSLDTTDSLAVQGPAGSSTQLDLVGGDTAATVGGSLNLILAEGISLGNPNPALSGLFGGIAETDFEPFTVNAFDPTNQDTYNSATSVNMFDSLGNPHVMTQYFVKEAFVEGDVNAPANRWSMYVQIDGANVGDPDVSLAPPMNTQSTMAVFNLQFDQSGQLSPFESDTVHISNWTPVDANGDPAGALGPVNILEGAVLPIPDPSVSSNFVIDLGDSTQFGSNFAVNQTNQNGFTTGRLNGLDIADDGTIFARYTNGENQILAQLVLANFSNNQGLSNLGGTSWAESFESGEPIIGAAGSASLGGISSGALEDSNVELSDELVQLIIAQRNFQASAKTIQTADAVTQTIINLR